MFEVVFFFFNKRQKDRAIFLRPLQNRYKLEVLL
jgi:hypothetical protein